CACGRSWSVVFFFSSRRRHTRFSRDWSSDVCSSDLLQQQLALGLVGLQLPGQVRGEAEVAGQGGQAHALPAQGFAEAALLAPERSEERRVGKECRSRWYTER